MKRISIALAGAAIIAAIVAAPTGAQGGPVYAPKDCTTPKIEPKRITLACADAGTALKHLRWNDWNADKVKGQGTLYVKKCKPNCSAGGFAKYPARVTLKNVQMYSCGGQTLPMYRRVHIRFKGKKPAHPQDYRSTKLFCNG